MSIRAHVQDIKSLYAENDYPSDRLVSDQEALAAFVKEFNRRVGGKYATEAVAEEIRRIRKCKRETGGLPHLGRTFHGPRFSNN